jgi:hypothetical protein
VRAAISAWVGTVPALPLLPPLPLLLPLLGAEAAGVLVGAEPAEPGIYCWARMVSIDGTVACCAFCGARAFAPPDFPFSELFV